MTITALVVAALVGVAIWTSWGASIAIPGTPNERNKLSEMQAIQLARKQLVLFDPEVFPRAAGRRDCTIHGGGPSPGMYIAGSCETSAVLDGNGGWLITFTEYWDASRFKSDPASTGTLSYRVTFDVNTDGKVTERYRGGDFPPQLAY